ncbi:ATP-binding protein [Listeria fleischmannii]|uniref:ATP-binding protein n=1 Tax=Listeria fleischmannii TaxID=1069827 RepID=A0A841YEG3_9LIST|nr:ATP-binding protein [Listeria fleischmannii]MBC1398620.1 ATP-binding protein [Listeria fleischmannii]
MVLPPRFNRLTMYDVIKECVDEDLNPISDDVIFDLQYLTFLEPAGQTILSNLIEWLGKRGCKRSITYKKYSSGDPDSYNKRVMQYLRDISFFAGYLAQEIAEPIGPRKNTCPLVLINYTESVNWIRHTFMPWMGSVLGVETSDIDYIQVSLEEIFNNVNDHSDVKTACISAQFYKKKGQLLICVSDFGTGISKTLEKKFPFLDEAERLREATKNGVSSFRNPHNRGFGLGNIIKAITAESLGSVHIHSNHGIIDANSLGIECQRSDTFYPGTFFEFIIDVEQARKMSNPEEEFAW